MRKGTYGKQIISLYQAFQESAGRGTQGLLSTQDILFFTIARTIIIIINVIVTPMTGANHAHTDVVATFLLVFGFGVESFFSFGAELLDVVGEFAGESGAIDGNSVREPADGLGLGEIFASPLYMHQLGCEES